MLEKSAPVHSVPPAFNIAFHRFISSQTSYCLFIVFVQLKITLLARFQLSWVYSLTLNTLVYIRMKLRERCHRHWTVLEDCSTLAFMRTTYRVPFLLPLGNSLSWNAFIFMQIFWQGQSLALLASFLLLGSWLWHITSSRGPRRKSLLDSKSWKSCFSRETL